MRKPRRTACIVLHLLAASKCSSRAFKPPIDDEDFIQSSAVSGIGRCAGENRRIDSVPDAWLDRRLILSCCLSRA